MELLHETVFVSHSFRSESENNRECDQQSFGDVGHDDTNQEKRRIQQIVTHEKWNDEECNSEEYSDGANQFHKMRDFSGHWSVVCIETRGQTCNATNESVVTRADNKSLGGP